MEFGFFLKKLVSFFVEPFGIVFTLLAVGLLFLYIKRERKAKIFLSLSLFFLFLFAYPPFSNFLVQNLEMKYSKYDNKEDIQYIHVLGNRHNTDETQPISAHLSNAGTKRVLEGVIIHNQIKNSKIIFTGYKGRTNKTNADMSLELALALGVKKTDIIIYGNPKDTKEEAEFTKIIVGNKAFVLVTSALHMPRSIMLFEEQGLHPIAAPTDFYKSEFQGYLRAPAPIYFCTSTRAMHEYIGIFWMKIRRVN